VRSKEGLILDHGKGALVFDTEGNSYLDCAAGIAVNILGHGNEALAEAVYDQIKKLGHASNLYHTDPSLTLAEKLVEATPGMQKIFFCNSGTEANEGAIKFARLISNSKNSNDRSRCIAFHGSFHGRSLGALSLTYKPAIRAPFRPLLNQNVTHLPFNDIRALEEAMDDDVMGVFLEPVQGEGGVRPADREFIQAARELCDKHNSVLVFDEIQIGLGRAGNGNLWGYEEYGVVPDILTAAKPLAGGLPIGAIMFSETAYSSVPENGWLGTHGSTFAGSPVACRAALVVLDQLVQPSFLENIKQAGARFIQGLVELEKKYPDKIVEVRRPLGDSALYAGIQVKVPSADVIKGAMERGLLIISAGDKGDVVRLCPPLITTLEQVEQCLDGLDQTFASLSAPEPKLKVETVKAETAFTSKSKHEAFIEENSVLPAGFRIGTSSFSFFPEELGESNTNPAEMKLTVIQPEHATSNYAALYTQNAFPGAPVKIGKSFLEQKQQLGAIVVNNKISNVSPRNGGVEDSLAVCDKVHSLLGLEPSAKVFPSSTGVIGWRLPVESMVDALPEAVGNMQSDSAAAAAEAIMTTDGYPKARTVEIKDESTGVSLGRITGIAKGAGMIEPNLATMLVYILTDMDVSDLQQHLKESINEPASFNSISVDSDQSTSDTVLLVSSAKKAKPEQVSDDEWAEAFQKGLKSVCTSLAHDVVRNGEGVEHVIKVSVTGSPSKELAKGAGKAVINSPLCKTAIAGNDPNVGRLIMAIGDYIGEKDPKLAKSLPQLVKIYVGNEVVFANGEFDLDGEKEAKLTQYMLDTKQSLDGHYPPHEQTLDITIDLGSGNHESVVLGSDLTNQYVDVNAGYRS